MGRMAGQGRKGFNVIALVSRNSVCAQARGRRLRFGVGIRCGHGLLQKQAWLQGGQRLYNMRAWYCRGVKGGSGGA